MRLLSVHVETKDYRFKSKLFAGNKDSPFDPGLLGFTIVAGPNGSGKTQLLSSLARTFHHVGWYPERAPAFALIEYELKLLGRSVPHLIASDGVAVRVTRSGESTLKFHDDLIPTVICSVFSTRVSTQLKRGRIFAATGKPKYLIYPVSTARITSLSDP